VILLFYLIVTTAKGSLFCSIVTIQFVIFMMLRARVGFYAPHQE
jgi:hypothetical protein